MLRIRGYTEITTAKRLFLLKSMQHILEVHKKIVVLLIK